MIVKALAPDTPVVEFLNWGLAEPMLPREVEANDPYLVVAPEDMFDITSVWVKKIIIIN